MHPIPLSVSERIQQFDAANGGNAIQIGSMLLYANGASREIDPLGILLDPPAQESRRLKNVVRYYKELHRRAVTEFDEMKYRIEQDAHIASRNGHGTRYTPEGVQRILGPLAVKARLRQRQLENTQALLNANGDYQSETFVDTARAINKSRCDAVIAATSDYRV